MAIFIDKPEEDLPLGTWWQDDSSITTNNMTYINPFTDLNLNFAGEGGLANNNSNLLQTKPPKNHPTHPSLIPSNALYEPVGSSVTVSPYGEGEDIDWLVWFESEQDEAKFIMDLAAQGFKPDGSQNYDTHLFISYKKGTENFILTYKAEFFDAFIKARNLCQFLNLKNKEDRIAVHQAIIKGEFPSYDPTPFASCGYGKEDPVW